MDKWLIELPETSVRFHLQKVLENIIIFYDKNQCSEIEKTNSTVADSEK